MLAMKRSLCSAAQSMTVDESPPRKRSSAAPPAGWNEYKWLHGQGQAFYQFDWNIYDFPPVGSAELPANDATDPNATRPVHPAPYLNVDGGGVLPVGYSEYHRLSFYNISWNAKSNKPWHTMNGLAIEICEMVHDKCVDAVGICGIFDLRDDPMVCRNPMAERWNPMAERRPDIMEHIVSKLNSGAERPTWKGKSDGHYIFVWNSNQLVLTAYNYISCGIEEHPWRMAQYLQFKPAESLYQSPVPLHVCHNHSPSSTKSKLCVSRACRIFATLWSHVMNNEPCGPKGVDSAVQPVAIFAGDFNCSPLTWVQCLQHEMATQACRRSVQVCFSKTPPSNNINDGALVFNACAVQEDSGWGKNHIRADKPPPFATDHDVVLVPFRWTRRLQTSPGSCRPLTSR